MRHSRNHGPVASRNAGVASRTAATIALNAYRIFCSLNIENILHSFKKNLLHLVFGAGVWSVFMRFRSLGINALKEDLHLIGFLAVSNIMLVADM